LDIHCEGMTTALPNKLREPQKKRATKEPLGKRSEVNIGHSRIHLQLEKEVDGG